MEHLAALAVVIVLVILIGPGLGDIRGRFSHGKPGWLAAGVVFELLSALSYVLIFRAVFCRRMRWRLSYLIGMAEQAANALLPAGGAGGLALGAWALRQGGVPTAHIGRRTVAFFLLTSLANFAALIVFACLFAVGFLGGDRAPGLTYGFGAAAAAGILVTFAIPRLIPPSVTAAGAEEHTSRLRSAVAAVRNAIGDGVPDAGVLVRGQPLGVLSGSLGYMAFDIAVLGVCFQAVGVSVGVGVLVVAYVIGQLGGLIPIPGGIGGTEGGLIGTFVVYNAPVAGVTAAVLAYRAIQIWLPALLGSVAFVQLRATLRGMTEPALACQPLAEPLPRIGSVSSGAEVSRA